MKAEELIDEIIARKLSMLPRNRLLAVAEAMRGLNVRGAGGHFVEAGSALGGVTVLLCGLMPVDARLAVFDVFETIPPPTEQDGADAHRRYAKIRSGRAAGIAGERYYGYRGNLQGEVACLLRGFGVSVAMGKSWGEARVTLIRGDLRQTLQIDRPVAFAHIDVDWYEPVSACLNRIAPWLMPGGCLIVDDYSDWSGARKACDEFERSAGERFRFATVAGARRITRGTEERA